MHWFRPLIVAIFPTVPLVSSATYVLQDNYVGTGFLSTFTHEAISDPTHGRVNYVSQSTALAKNLTYVAGDTLILRADDTTVLSSSGPGRNSVRIQSVKSYTTHVAVLDVRHMPQGCGTWPAFWETDGSDWPNGGEIDIGVNDVSPNLVSVHTGSNCTMPAGGSSTRLMTGTATANNCDVNTDGNSGCGVSATSQNSYGPSFNANGGGWYAMERTNSFLKVWFWPRNSQPPSDVADGEGAVDTSNWGTPLAYFPNTSCNIASHFDENNIIINLTFCGDWAGSSSVYSSSGCPDSCVDYVNNNPSAFTNAYWDIASLRVYE